MGNHRVQIRRAGGVTLTPVFHKGEDAARFVTCQSKKRFATRKHAKRNGYGNEPYRCRYCGEWHVGSRK